MGFDEKAGLRKKAKRENKYSPHVVSYVAYIFQRRAGAQLLGWKSGFENTAFLFHFLY